MVIRVLDKDVEVPLHLVLREVLVRRPDNSQQVEQRWCFWGEDGHIYMPGKDVRSAMLQAMGIVKIRHWPVVE